MKLQTSTSVAQLTARTFINMTRLILSLALIVGTVPATYAQNQQTQNQEARTVKTSSRRSNKSKLNYGRIELTTSTGEYPVIVDGAPNGTSSPMVRYIDLAPGSRTLEVNFPNGTRYVNTFNIEAGRRYCIALNYRPRTIRVAPSLASPCPYNVNVSASATVNDGDLLTFTSDTVYTGTAPLKLTWTVSPSTARITSGQGTNSITVDTTGLGDGRVTATLLADDGSGDPNCRQSAQATTMINSLAPAIVTPKRFDEFPSVTFDDDKARLDNLAIELQNQPTARGYIILYPGTRSNARKINQLTNRTRNYLVTTRGIDASRLTVITASPRERDYFELYLVPQGAEPPMPR